MYEINHFSFDTFLDESITIEWPNLEEIDPELNSYGVCDRPNQIKNKFGMKLNFSNRYFIISFTPVLKSEQPSEGGWRWEKWGPYIGNRKPEADYLYDEPKIEKIDRSLVTKRLKEKQKTKIKTEEPKVQKESESQKSKIQFVRVNHQDIITPKHI